MFPGESISKKKPSKRSEKRQFAYTLFLMHLPYSNSKAIRIHVLYHPWHRYFIIWMMNMRQNISSRVSKNLFWKFMIKVGCTSAVIFLWGITEKKRKKAKLSYWVMAYIHAIWYIAESVYLSNCLFVTSAV